MIRLNNILKEIIESAMTRYNWKIYENDDDESKTNRYRYDWEFYGNDASDIRYYGFYTEHYPYSVKIMQDENEIEIEFYVPDKEDPNLDTWNIETNKGNVHKIMSTISHIVKEDLKKHPEVDTIQYTAVRKKGKSDNNARTDLYLKFLKRQYPNAEHEKYGDTTIVKIK